MRHSYVVGGPSFDTVRKRLHDDALELDNGLG